MTCPVCKQPMSGDFRMISPDGTVLYYSGMCSLGCFIDFLISLEAAEIAKGTK